MSNVNRVLAIDSLVNQGKVGINNCQTSINDYKLKMQKEEERINLNKKLNEYRNQDVNTFTQLKQEFQIYVDNWKNSSKDDWKNKTGLYAEYKGVDTDDTFVSPVDFSDTCKTQACTVTCPAKGNDELSKTCKTEAKKMGKYYPDDYYYNGVCELREKVSLAKGGLKIKYTCGKDPSLMKKSIDKYNSVRDNPPFKDWCKTKNKITACSGTPECPNTTIDFCTENAGDDFPSKNQYPFNDTAVTIPTINCCSNIIPSLGADANIPDECQKLLDEAYQEFVKVDKVKSEQDAEKAKKLQEMKEDKEAQDKVDREYAAQLKIQQEEQARIDKIEEDRLKAEEKNKQYMIAAGICIVCCVLMILLIVLLK